MVFLETQVYFDVFFHLSGKNPPKEQFFSFFARILQKKYPKMFGGKFGFFHISSRYFRLFLTFDFWVCNVGGVWSRKSEWTTNGTDNVLNFSPKFRLFAEEEFPKDAKTSPLTHARTLLIKILMRREVPF